MQDIKLVAADLDGTLLNDEKQLCPGAEETIRRLAARGISLVPVTGRPLRGVPAFLRKMEEIKYIITSNGAQIHENQSGKSVLSFPMSNALCQTLVRELSEKGAVFEPFTHGTGYTTPAVYKRYMKLFSGTALEDYFVCSRTVIDAPGALFDDGETTADEFFVTCFSEGERERLTAALDALSGVQYWTLGDRFMEITAVGCDKGAALTALCARCGVDIKNTVAFGDGENDLALLKAAGLAVAMDNAFSVVKENAAMIAPSNNHNGVCQWLSDYCLSKPE